MVIREGERSREPCLPALAGIIWAREDARPPVRVAGPASQSHINATSKPGISHVLGRGLRGTSQVHAWYMRGTSQVGAGGKRGKLDRKATWRTSVSLLPRKSRECGFPLLGEAPVWPDGRGWQREHGAQCAASVTFGTSGDLDRKS